MGAEPVELSLTTRQPLVPARVAFKRVARRIAADGDAAGRGGATEAVEDEDGEDHDEDAEGGGVSVVVPVAVDDGVLAVLTWWSPDERIAISAPADNISNAPIAAVSGRTPLTQPQRTNLNDT